MKRLTLLTILASNLLVFGCSESAETPSPGKTDADSASSEQTIGNELSDYSILSKEGVRPEKVVLSDNYPDAISLEEVLPGLASSVLKHASLANLPDGIILHSGSIVVSEEELDSHIKQAPAAVREQFAKNAFFMLEQSATPQILLALAKTELAGETEEQYYSDSDDEIIEAYLQQNLGGITVSDEEIKQFYEENKAMIGDQPFNMVKQSIRQMLEGQKQQQIVDGIIQSAGLKVDIFIDRKWAQKMREKAIDNPVDQARRSGLPTLVDFGAEGCAPCEMLQPILAELRMKYIDRVNILFVSVAEEQILGARYGVQSIPVLVFYDEKGEEFYRHSGFWPRESIENIFARMGIDTTDS